MCVKFQGVVLVLLLAGGGTLWISVPGYLKCERNWLGHQWITCNFSLTIMSLSDPFFISERYCFCKLNHLFSESTHNMDQNSLLFLFLLFSSLRPQDKFIFSNMNFPRLMEMWSPVDECFSQFLFAYIFPNSFLSFQYFHDISTSIASLKDEI